MMVRVLTCNLQRAGEARTARQADWLLAAGADVLVLTEVSAGAPGHLLSHTLTAHGYRVLLPDPGVGDRCRILLAARDTDPLGVDIGLGELAHRGIAARVGRLGVVGLYVPSRGPKARRNQDKRAFQHRVGAVLPALERALDVPGPVVVAGDLNVVEPDHVPRQAVFGAWEYDFYRAFGQAGLVDAFRVTHPTTVDHSWFGRPSASGHRNGYRLDHVFVSARHRDSVVECRYDHSARIAGLTDHAALTLELATD